MVTVARIGLEYAAVYEPVSTLDIGVFGEEFGVCGMRVSLGVTIGKYLSKYLDGSIIVVGSG
jgi:hypothetical protein